MKNPEKDYQRNATLYALRKAELNLKVLDDYYKKKGEVPNNYKALLKLFNKKSKPRYTITFEGDAWLEAHLLPTHYQIFKYILRHITRSPENGDNFTKMYNWGIQDKKLLFGYSQKFIADRIKIVRGGKKVGVSRTTVYKAMKRFEELGIMIRTEYKVFWTSKNTKQKHTSEATPVYSLGYTVIDSSGALTDEGTRILPFFYFEDIAEADNNLQFVDKN